MSKNPVSRRRFLAGAGLGVAGAALVGPRLVAAAAAAKVGAAAPGFSLPATTGATQSLGDLHGKLVVLEWTNHECPYVRKHYESGNMQALQREATGQGVVWLTIISSAPGTEGHVTAPQADELTVSRKAAPTAVLLDPQGTVGRLYGATNTPHMYVRGCDRRPAHDATLGRPGRQQLRARGARVGDRGPAGEDAGHPRLWLHGEVLLSR
jgi:peroxiredoxin